MSHLAKQILIAAQEIPEGGLLSLKEFLRLGSRAAIDKTLSRLAQEEKLLRVSRGAYIAPHQGRFGVRPPSTAAVAQAIEASFGETVVANGATDANALGLTTQVPTPRGVLYLRYAPYSASWQSLCRTQARQSLATLDGQAPCWPGDPCTVVAGV